MKKIKRKLSKYGTVKMIRKTENEVTIVITHKRPKYQFDSFNFVGESMELFYDYPQLEYVDTFGNCAILILTK
jgi:hypothetical protein